MQKYGGGYLHAINLCMRVLLRTYMDGCGIAKYEILQKDKNTFHLAILYEEHVKAVI